MLSSRRVSKKRLRKLEPANHDAFSIDYLPSEHKSIHDFMRRYKIEKGLGVGGQAKVYEAIDH